MKHTCNAPPRVVLVASCVCLWLWSVASAVGTRMRAMSRCILAVYTSYKQYITVWTREWPPVRVSCAILKNRQTSANLGLDPAVELARRFFFSFFSFYKLNANASSPALDSGAPGFVSGRTRLSLKSRRPTAVREPHVGLIKVVSSRCRRRRRSSYRAHGCPRVSQTYVRCSGGGGKGWSQPPLRLPLLFIAFFRRVSPLARRRSLWRLTSVLVTVLCLCCHIVKLILRCYRRRHRRCRCSLRFSYPFTTYSRHHVIA